MKRDIISEAESILRKSMKSDKPEFINVTDADWEAAHPLTKGYLMLIERLHKPLESAYYEAVARQDWYRALITYQRLVGHPTLYSLDRLITSDEECFENEANFTRQAMEWVNEVSSLLKDAS